MLIAVCVCKVFANCRQPRACADDYNEEKKCGNISVDVFLKVSLHVRNVIERPE